MYSKKEFYVCLAQQYTKYIRKEKNQHNKNYFHQDVGLDVLGAWSVTKSVRATKTESL